MKREKEWMDTILAFAQGDDRIRVVGMEGSRTNPNVPKDEFQDYDITFVVTEMESFQGNDDWLDTFGERIMMQKPEGMALFPPELGNWYSYLILFRDGSKLDLTLVPIEELDRYLASDCLMMILLDKDDRVATRPVPTDERYHVIKPTERCFHDCCNEFWMTSYYVAKGLCRREILFAIDHLNQIVRPELLRMLTWRVGIETDFRVSVGKNYKYLEHYVSPETWARLLATYRNGTYDDVWDALFVCHFLFRETAASVAQSLGFAIFHEEKEMVQFLQGLYLKGGRRTAQP